MKLIFTAEDFRDVIQEAVFTDDSRWGADKIAEIVSAKAAPFNEHLEFLEKENPIIAERLRIRTEQVTKLREALEFYGNEANWYKRTYANHILIQQLAGPAKDDGKFARAALEGV